MEVVVLADNLLLFILRRVTNRIDRKVPVPRVAIRRSHEPRPRPEPSLDSATVGQPPFSLVSLHTLRVELVRMPLRHSACSVGVRKFLVVRTSMNMLKIVWTLVAGILRALAQWIGLDWPASTL